MSLRTALKKQPSGSFDASGRPQSQVTRSTAEVVTDLQDLLHYSERMLQCAALPSPSSRPPSTRQPQACLLDVRRTRLNGGLLVSHPSEERRAQKALAPSILGKILSSRASRKPDRANRVSGYCATAISFERVKRGFLRFSFGRFEDGCTSPYPARRRYASTSETFDETENWRKLSEMRAPGRAVCFECPSLHSGSCTTEEARLRKRGRNIAAEVASTVLTLRSLGSRCSAPLADTVAEGDDRDGGHERAERDREEDLRSVARSAHCRSPRPPQLGTGA